MAALTKSGGDGLSTEASDLTIGACYRSREPVSVVFRWWYDTVAILDEYDDAEEGILPAGEKVTVVEVAQDAQRVLCVLENAKEIEKTLPKGRVYSTFLCRPTRLQADIRILDLTSRFEKISGQTIKG